MSNFCDHIAGFVVDTGFNDIPDSVEHEAKRTLLDSVGCARNEGSLPLGHADPHAGHYPWMRGLLAAT